MELTLCAWSPVLGGGRCMDDKRYVHLQDDGLLVGGAPAHGQGTLGAVAEAEPRVEVEGVSAVAALLHSGHHPQPRHRRRGCQLHLPPAPAPLPSMQN